MTEAERIEKREFRYKRMKTIYDNSMLVMKENERLQEQLKQKEDENRELWNKAIDKCIVIIRNAVKTGFPHYHIASVLQTLKRKENESEFTHPDETED